MNMKDYIPDPLYARTMPPEGAIGGKGLVRGPVASPIALGPSDMTPAQALSAIARMLERLPDQLATTFRTKFPIPPRESVPIFRSAADVEVAAASQVDVITFTVPDKYNGFLTHVGFNAVGSGSFDDITWSIRSGQMVHPSLSELNVFANTLATPYPFQFEVIQGRSIVVSARNSGGAAIDVSAVLIGWLELMTEAKPYGTSPWSGIG